MIVLSDMLQNMFRDEIIITSAEDVSGLEDSAKLLIEGDVAKVPVFDEVDESGEFVEDGGKVILNAIFTEELVVLHRDFSVS